jgi:uncharacterized membrane protein YjjP (DUF1212 family)
MGASDLEKLPAIEELSGRHPAVDFLLKLGMELHACGVSTFRLESMMTLVAQKLGLPLQIFSMPTGLFVAFGTQERQVTFLLRVEPGNVNLERLALLYQVAEAIIAGELSPENGAGLVAAIRASPPRFGTWPTTCCFCLFSPAVATLFHGGWKELLVSAVIGLSTGLIALAAGRWAAVGRLFEFLAATAAPVVAALASTLLGPFSGYLVIAAGLIVLMPGLSLTTAMNELANRHLAAGTARLAAVSIVFMALAFGTALGKSLASLIPGVEFADRPEALPEWMQIPGVLMSAVCLAVLFQARPRDFGWILVAAVTAMAGTLIGNQLLDAQLGGFVAALIVGIAGNSYGRYCRQSSLIFLIPGITLLVPGTVGYRSLSALLEKDVVSGVNTAFSMSLIAISLVAGLLFANVLVPPRRQESM